MNQIAMSISRSQTRKHHGLVRVVFKLFRFIDSTNNMTLKNVSIKIHFLLGSIELLFRIVGSFSSTFITGNNHKTLKQIF